MAHMTVKNRLNEYLNGECSPSEIRMIEEHLKECRRCREELEAAREVRELFLRSGKRTASPHYAARFAERLKMVQTKRPKAVPGLKFVSIRPRRIPAPALAAVMVAGIVLGAITLQIRARRLPLIRSVEGKVLLRRAGEIKWSSITADTRINKDDVLLTGRKSRVDIDLPGKYRLRCFEDSQVVASSKTMGGWIDGYSLRSGRVVFLIRKSLRKSRFRVETPAATAVVTGTKFALRLGRAGATTVSVVEGSVSFQGHYKSSLPNSNVTVTAGKVASAAPFQFPSDPTPLTEEELNRIKEDISGIEEENPARQVLMKEMKGENLVTLILPEGPDRLEAFLKGVSLNYSEKLPAPILRLLREAHLRCREGRYEEGIQVLEEIVSNYPETKFRSEILLFISSLYYSALSNPEAALASLERVVREEVSKWDPLAQCARALILQRLGSGYQLRAERIYRNVAIKFPRSPEAKYARAALTGEVSRK